MNVLVLLVVALTGLFALWVMQTALLIVARQRPWLAWPLRHRCKHPIIRWGMKAVVQLVLLGVLFGFPAAIGEDPIEYHLARLKPASWPLLFGVAGTTVLAMMPMLLFNIAVGWVRLNPRYTLSKTVRKVLRSLLTPLPLAFVEEALFRGVILDQLLKTIPGAVGNAAALITSAAIFAAAHFFRPQKRLLLPAVGLFGLGVMLGVAYVIGGHSYWLPVGVHAGGVLFILLHRPLVEYRGPAVLIGYSSYPNGGLFGLTIMAAYVAALAYWFKGLPVI